MSHACITEHVCRCHFECQCPKHASWNQEERFQAPPIYSECGCEACTATSVLRANAPPRPLTPIIKVWPRRVPSPRPAPEISRLLRPPSSASHRNSPGLLASEGHDGMGALSSGGGGRRKFAVSSRGYGRPSTASNRPATTVFESSSVSSSCSRGERKQNRHRGKPFIEYLGVKYQIETYVLEGAKEGSVLARALDTNSRVLLQDFL